MCAKRLLCAPPRRIHSEGCIDLLMAERGDESDRGGEEILRTKGRKRGEERPPFLHYHDDDQSPSDGKSKISIVSTILQIEEEEERSYLSWLEEEGE